MADRFYVAYNRNVPECWGRYDGILDFDEWFDRLSRNPKNAGYLGKNGKLVQDFSKAKIFDSEMEAHCASDPHKINPDLWEAVINPLD